MFCGDGRQLPAVGARRAWRGGLWDYRARMCQREGMWAARQKGPVPALAFLRLENNMGRRKEKQRPRKAALRQHRGRVKSSSQLPIDFRSSLLILD